MDLWRGGREFPDPLVFRERPLSVKRRADRGKRPRRQGFGGKPRKAARKRDGSPGKLDVFK
jgi:hypothetical protein